jgi:hypothetical protein
MSLNLMRICKGIAGPTVLRERRGLRVVGNERRVSGDEGVAAVAGEKRRPLCAAYEVRSQRRGIAGTHIVAWQV